MPGIHEKRVDSMEDLKWSRYEDYRIHNYEKFRVEICIAEIRYNNASGKKHKYYANVCKFPDGTIRIYNNRHAKADVAQDALDIHADDRGWRHVGFNHRLPVIDTYDGSEKKEIVPVYN